MKKKNGFTLVELLAVIVVLAIIMVIAIPSVLDALNSSRKDSFYLYAQKLYSEGVSKYTRDLDENPDKVDCAVYDIKNDLGLSDTGSFDGWVRVSRKAVSSGKNKVSITISADKELMTIKHCVGDGTSCTPKESFFVPDGTKKTTITKAVKKGQVLCVSYQLPNDKNVLETQPTQCKPYDQGQEYVDTYEYEVNLSLTNKSYSVENLIISDKTEKETVFKAMEDFPKTHDSLAISKPSCVAGDNEQKGTTSTGVTQVTNVNESTNKTSVVTNSTSNIQSTQTVTTNEQSTQGTQTVSSTSGVQGGSTNTTIVTNPTEGSTSEQQTVTVSNPSSTYISNERSTTIIDKTTVAVKDDTLMLSELNVQGYNLEFNPATYYYEMTVPNNVTSLNVTAKPKSENSQCNVSGQTDLAVGENLILTEVVDVTTGKRGYYRIFVTRFNEKGEKPTTKTTSQVKTTIDTSSGLPDPSLDESNASLKRLKVSGYNLDFNPEVYEYTLETNGEKEIYITALPEKNGASVLVTGADDVKDGSEVQIKVRSRNTFYEKTYTIKIKCPTNETGSTKTFRIIAIGLLGLLAVVGIILALTKNNRKKRSEYTGTVDATSGPGVNNNIVPTNDAPAPMSNNMANQLPQTPVAPQNNSLPVTPQAPTDNNQVPPNNMPPQ